MLPDVTTPTTCPTCGADKSHDVRNVDTLALLGRVFQCGAAVSTAAAGAWSTAVICPRSEEIIFHLSADNVRLGDRGVLVAIAMLAAIEGLEKSLRAWATLPLDSLPKMALLELAPLRAAHDELVDALEGAAPAAVAPTEPAKASADLSETAAGARTSCSSE